MDDLVPPTTELNTLLTGDHTLNFVKYSYDCLGNVVALRQGAEGKENTAAADPKRRTVTYGYAATDYTHPRGGAPARYVRPVSMMYPDAAIGSTDLPPVCVPESI